MTKTQSSFVGFVTFALASSLWCVFAWGQTAPPPSGTLTLHVSTDLIQVPVLALKPPFRPASGLVRTDFVIRLDGGPPFHPNFARIEGAEPLSLGILVEADARESGPLSKGLQAALQSWTPDLLLGSDRLSLSIYGCRFIRSLHDMPADLTLRRDQLVQAISPTTFQAAMKEGESCSRPPVNQVLEAAIDQLANTTNWKVLLLIVNGEHKTDPDSLRRVQALAAAEGVTLFAVKYLRNASFSASVYSDTEGINVLVSSLGGITVHSSFDELGAVTETIIKDTRQRYILSFPGPRNGSAGAHRLEIKTTAKGVKVWASAASAPLLDSTHCTDSTGMWLCSEQRPKYGTDNPLR